MTLRAWLSRCLQWRIGWGWLAFALLFPLGGAIATAPASGHLPLFFRALVLHTAINF